MPEWLSQRCCCLGQQLSCWLLLLPCRLSHLPLPHQTLLPARLPRLRLLLSGTLAGPSGSNRRTAASHWPNPRPAGVGKHEFGRFMALWAAAGAHASPGTGGEASSCTRAAASVPSRSCLRSGLMLVPKKHYVTHYSASTTTPPTHQVWVPLQEFLHADAMKPAVCGRPVERLGLNCHFVADVRA